MSTIKVNRIENTSTTDGGVSIDVNGHVTIDGQQLPTAGPLSNRNLIINGAMNVAQRGAGPFTNASGGYQTVDRFQLEGTLGGNFTLEQASDAPNGSGFSKSFKALAPTGFPSLTAGASAKVKTSIEAQNLQQLLYGTSDAVYITVSFWVKATVTGTYILEISQDDATRHLSTAYTISSSDTWEKKTISVVGDTSGTINNDNGSGLSLNWFIGAGSNFTSGTLATTWAATVAANRAVGQVNGAASNGDAFYITGVQLEVGSKSTPFEHESYGQTLAKCQRYFQKLVLFGGVVCMGSDANRTARYPQRLSVKMSRTPTAINLVQDTAATVTTQTGTVSTKTEPTAIAPRADDLIEVNTLAFNNALHTIRYANASVELDAELI